MAELKIKKEKEPRKPFMTVMEYNVYVDPNNYTVEKGSKTVYYPSIEQAMAHINRDVLNGKLTIASKSKTMTLDECVTFVKAHNEEMKALWGGY